MIKKPHNHISDAFANNIDLILELHKFTSLPHLKFNITHIDSHQDKHTAFEYLSILAKKNVLADNAADLQYTHPIQDHHINISHLPTQLISISNRNGRILSHFHDELLRYEEYN